MAINLAHDRVGAEVITASCYDPRHPPSAVIDDNDASFWSTTGNMPQECIIRFPGDVSISKIKTVTTNVRHLTVDKCDSASPVSWERVYSIESADTDGRPQVEATQTSKLSATFLRFRIMDSWDDFCTVHRIIVEGTSS